MHTKTPATEATTEKFNPVLRLKLTATILLTLFADAVHRATQALLGNNDEKIEVEIPTTASALANANANYVNNLLYIAAKKLTTVNPHSVLGWIMLWSTKVATGKKFKIENFIAQAPENIRSVLQVRLSAIDEYFVAHQYAQIPVGAIAIAVLHNTLRTLAGQNATQLQGEVFYFEDNYLVTDLATLRTEILKVLTENGETVQQFANFVAITGTADGNGLGMFMTIETTEIDVLVAALNATYANAPVTETPSTVIDIAATARTHPADGIEGGMGLSLNPEVREQQRSSQIARGAAVA